jgi:hypothetical protein
MEGSYFSIPKLLETIESKKTLSDFKKTDIYDNLLEIDKESIVGNMCKYKYYRTILYWAEPTFAVFIEAKENWKEAREKAERKKLRGIIYLVKISDHLFKFGRTENMKKRINQYPRGSIIVKYENVEDMYKSENILLNCAKESNGYIYQGNEFFYFNNEDEPLEVFNKALDRIQNYVL